MLREDFGEERATVLAAAFISGAARFNPRRQAMVGGAVRGRSGTHVFHPDAPAVNRTASII